MVYANRCVAPESTTAGAPAIIDLSSGEAIQQWSANADGTISNGAAPNLCLTEDNGVRLQECTGADNQRWTLG